MQEQEFDTNIQGAEGTGSKSERLERLRGLFKYLLKRLIVFISFGPGVLGIIWLLGRLIRR